MPVISGALHYFRVHPDEWAARLRALHFLGFDTIETYVPWNLHEPAPGEHVFDGLADLGRFLDLVAAEGLGAIVRPGPYICAEWDNGGLPAWLTGQPGIRVRTCDPDYLAAVDAWFDVLAPVIAVRQSDTGGPVAMVQVENEYGSYGSDADYLEHLRAGLRDRGITVPLFTSDGPTEYMLAGGTLPGVRATVNFGSDPEEAFGLLARLRPDDEPFCMEYWNGWFDHWGTSHHVRTPRTRPRPSTGCSRSARRSTSTWRRAARASAARPAPTTTAPTDRRSPPMTTTPRSTRPVG